MKHQPVVHPTVGNTLIRHLVTICLCRPCRLRTTSMISKCHLLRVQSVHMLPKWKLMKWKKTKDSKYNRKSTDSLVKRILGESEKDRKSKYKINMGGEEEGEELDKDSLLQRRLASLDKSGRRPRGGDEYMVEEYEHEELTYSRKSRGRMNRQGSGDQEPPRDYRGGRQGSRGSFEFDDDYEDQRYDRGYRGRGRFARQQYIDDDDVFGPLPPFVPLFRDEEFETPKARRN